MKTHQKDVPMKHTKINLQSEEIKSQPSPNVPPGGNTPSLTFGAVCTTPAFPIISISGSSSFHVNRRNLSNNIHSSSTSNNNKNSGNTVVIMLVVDVLIVQVILVLLQ